MNMDTSDLATSQHAEDVHHHSSTLSQSEMDAVGVLLEFTPANQPEEHAVVQWSGKRKRSYRLGNSEYKEGEKFCTAKVSAFDQGEHLLPHKRALINAAVVKLSKDLHARATSPNSPLPSSQMQCGTIGLEALSAPQKIPRVAVKETSLLCKPQSVPKAEEKKKQASITKDLDIARCKDVDVVSDALIKPTSEAKIQPVARVPSKSANAFLLKNLCRQLLKLAVRLGCEIKGMRHTKSLLMEELQSLKNQNFCLKQQHSLTKAIQTTNASKPQVPSSPSSARDRCTVPQNHRVIKEGDERAGGTTDYTSGSTGHNSNASTPTTSSSIDLNRQDSEECNIKAPDCISWTSPHKEPRPTSVEDAQRGAHAELSFSNAHGFIDAHGTWVIVPESTENYGDSVRAQLTCSTREESSHQADGVRAQTRGDPYVQAQTWGDPCVDITCSPCKQKVTPVKARATSCAEDIPAQLAAPHYHLNRRVDSVLTQQSAYSNHCADIGAPFHSKSLPQNLSCSVDGIPAQRTHYLQSPNHRFNTASAQLLPYLPLQISNNAALAQLASTIYERLPQAIVLLCDRKLAFAEARKRRREITRIKRGSHQSRASKLH